MGESAVASGVRRIEAVTGASAEAVVAETQTRLNDAAGALRTAPAEVPERIAALLDNNRKLERQVADLQKKLATAAPPRRPRTSAGSSCPRATWVGSGA